MKLILMMIFKIYIYIYICVQKEEFIVNQNLLVEKELNGHLKNLVQKVKEEQIRLKEELERGLEGGLE